MKAKALALLIFAGAVALIHSAPTNEVDAFRIPEGQAQRSSNACVKALLRVGSTFEKFRDRLPTELPAFAKTGASPAWFQCPAAAELGPASVVVSWEEWRTNRTTLTNFYFQLSGSGADVSDDADWRFNRKPPVYLRCPIHTLELLSSGAVRAKPQ